MHYQWLAKTFLSQKEIDKIIGKTETKTAKQNNSLIKVNSSENDITKVERQTIEGDNYTGIALIIMAISSTLYYWFDDNPETNPALNQTINQVVDGVNQIKGVNNTK